mmetsp:Transcript_65329/g.108494  ORF Transcript_65329/g.108494 Transcript_65329/m.108494 type:complete len:236 (-) Transcript_65329:230-937(-)
MDGDGGWRVTAGGWRVTASILFCQCEGGGFFHSPPAQSAAVPPPPSHTTEVGMWGSCLLDCAQSNAQRHICTKGSPVRGGSRPPSAKYPWPTCIGLRVRTPGACTVFSGACVRARGVVRTTSMEIEHQHVPPIDTMDGHAPVAQGHHELVRTARPPPSPGAYCRSLVMSTPRASTMQPPGIGAWGLVIRTLVASTVGNLARRLSATSCARASIKSRGGPSTIRFTSTYTSPLLTV